MTAYHPDSFIGGVSANAASRIIRLKPLPQEDYESYQWVSPDADPHGEQNCANCHAAVYREWAGSGHARSATNRHFLNLYDGTDAAGRPDAGWSLRADHPDGVGVCTACHAPTVAFDDPAYFDLRQVRGVAARGVHCDFCHKVADVQGEPGLTHGRFALQVLRPAEGQLFFGPLDDVDRGEDAFSPLYRDSRYCAACHEGVVFGVPVYRTYSEWRASPAARRGQQCQDCHMAPTGSLTNLAPGHGGIPRDPATLGNHAFFAPSQQAMLERCLRVTPDLVRTPAGIRVRVTVRADGVGHRVPTGFIDRHLLLTLEATGQDGRPVQALAGPTLPGPAGRGLTGQAGLLFARLLRDEHGHSPVPFWRAVPEPHDTRLVPGQPVTEVWTFPPTAQRLRLRLLHRRFWDEVARAKGWTDHETVVVDSVLSIPPSSSR